MKICDRQSKDYAETIERTAAAESWLLGLFKTMVDSGGGIHFWLDNPAFKDHDYNVVTDSNLHRKYVVDPTVFGAFCISRVVEQD